MRRTAVKTENIKTDNVKSYVCEERCGRERVSESEMDYQRKRMRVFVIERGGQRAID